VKASAKDYSREDCPAASHAGKNRKGKWGMKGLGIRTVTGEEFEVHGEVKYSAEYDVYYCAGQSWPSSIVTGVLE